MPNAPFSRAAAVIPVRAFAAGMHRLAPALDAGARAALARHLATQVLRAAEPLPVVVVSSDPEVRTWASALGIEVLSDPGSLDAAAAAGLAHWRAAGAERVVVAHADLPLAPGGSLARLAEADSADPVVALVPSHRDLGTPVLSLPAGAAFDFSYGPGSLLRHAAAARAAGLTVRMVHDAALGFDVDEPVDLDALPDSLWPAAAPRRAEPPARL